MADEEKEAPVVKSPQQIADETKAAEDERRRNQTEFDPKLHGVGTIQVEEPGSVRELFQYTKNRLDAIEKRLRLR